MRVERLARGLRGFGDVQVAGQRDLQRAGFVPRLATGGAIQIDDPGKRLHGAAEQRQRHRRAEPAGARRTLRSSADPDPHRNSFLTWAGRDLGIVERRAEAARPADLLVALEALQELIGFEKKRIVVVQVGTEQRERFDVSATPRDDFGATSRQQVERREILEHAYRIGGTEHRDCAGQANPPRCLRNRSKDHRWRRNRKVVAVMLTDTEHVESCFVGEFRCGDGL